MVLARFSVISNSYEGSRSNRSPQRTLSFWRCNKKGCRSDTCQAYCNKLCGPPTTTMTANPEFVREGFWQNSTESSSWAGLFVDHGVLCGVRSPRYLRASQWIGRCAPQPLASPACASARNIDAEGPRIENKLERAFGTNGRSVIWPSNSRAQRPGTLVPHDGQEPFEVRW